MTPDGASERLLQIRAALYLLALLGRFEVSSIDIFSSGTAVVWISPPTDGSQLAGVAELYSRTSLGRSVEEIKVVRARAYRVELRWIERFERVAKVPS